VLICQCLQFTLQGEETGRSSTLGEKVATHQVAKRRTLPGKEALKRTRSENRQTTEARGPAIRQRGELRRKKKGIAIREKKWLPYP